MTRYQDKLTIDFWRSWCLEATADSVHQLLHTKCSQLLPLCELLRDDRESGDRRRAVEQLSALVQECIEISGAALHAPDADSPRLRRTWDHLHHLNRQLAALECIPRSAQRYDHVARKLEWAVRHTLREESALDAQAA